MSIQQKNNAYKKTGLKHFYYAFTYSLNGFRTAFLNEAAFRQELCFVFIGVIITLFLSISPVEKVLLIGSLLIILIVELLNSAIESVVDRISEERHPLSKAAKDLGSAAVFTAITLCVITWVVILGHHFLH